MTTGLDYSAGRIPGAAIRAAGHGFVIRYVDDPAVGLNSKHITPGEYADLVAAGVDVRLVFEVSTGDMLGGYQAGVAHAQRARRGADWIGYPPGGLIFMASDMHNTAPQVQVSMTYVDGATSVLGKNATGVYGFWELIDACIATGRGVAWWQCGIRPGPADGVHVWQRNAGQTTTVLAGIECDINDLLLPLPTLSAASSPNKSKVEHVIENHQVVGAGTLEFNCPIKGESALYGAAWLSARDTHGGGKVDAYWGESGKGGRGEAHWANMALNWRYRNELTGGDVDQMTVRYDFGTGGLGVITVEYIPK